MPTYEYECQKCGHAFELFQSIKDAPKKTCPKCKGRIKRLISTGGGLLFKGSGFYATDYRKPGYSEAAKKDSPAATPRSPHGGAPNTRLHSHRIRSVYCGTRITFSSAASFAVDLAGTFPPRARR